MIEFFKKYIINTFLSCINILREQVTEKIAIKEKRFRLEHIFSMVSLKKNWKAFSAIKF